MNNRKIWNDERHLTPEQTFLDRRQWLQRMVAAGLLAGSALHAQEPETKGSAAPLLGGAQGQSHGEDLPGPKEPPRFHAPAGTFPAARNERYVAARALTAQAAATSYNNFYEFSTNKQAVHQLVGKFETAPWKVAIKGLVEKPGIADLEDFFRHLPSEERIYRFRCVEAWAMTVPWTGFPMHKLLEWVRPKPQARYVRMVSFLRPAQAPGQRSGSGYSWPFYEALTLPEAAHELTLLAHGIYGKELPPQNGAPLRLVVPWKYGLKNIKSIVELEFTEERPRTFWNDAFPDEYSWSSNVEPHVPHPRWSQETERLIPNGARVPTKIYNGYADLVAKLYA